MKHVVHKPLQTNCFPCEQFLSQWMSFWRERGRTHFFPVSRQIIVYLSQYSRLTRSELSQSKPGLRPPSITLLIRESQRRARAALSPGCLVPPSLNGLVVSPLSCLMSLHVTRCHSPGEHYQCHHHSLSLNTRPVLWEEADCLKISDQSRHYRAEIVTGAGYHYRHSI